VAVDDREADERFGDDGEARAGLLAVLALVVLDGVFDDAGAVAADAAQEFGGR
jgi:hypothetical protein